MGNQFGSRRVGRDPADPNFYGMNRMIRDDEVAMSLLRGLRVYRHKRGILLEQLAARINLSRSAIGNAERYPASTTYRTYTLIAEYMSWPSYRPGRKIHPETQQRKIDFPEESRKPSTQESPTSEAKKTDTVGSASQNLTTPASSAKSSEAVKSASSTNESLRQKIFQRQCVDVIAPITFEEECWLRGRNASINKYKLKYPASKFVLCAVRWVDKE